MRTRTRDVLMRSDGSTKKIDDEEGGSLAIAIKKMRGEESDDRMTGEESN